MNIYKPLSKDGIASYLEKDRCELSLDWDTVKDSVPPRYNDEAILESYYPAILTTMRVIVVWVKPIQPRDKPPSLLIPEIQDSRHEKF